MSSLTKRSLPAPSSALASVKHALRPYIINYRELESLRTADAGFHEAKPLIDSVQGFLNPIEAVMLYHLARFGPGIGRIVAIGSYQGKSTACLALGLRDRIHRDPIEKVLVVDPHTGDRELLRTLGIERMDTEAQFRENMGRLNLNGLVEPVIHVSKDAAQNDTGEPVRLLFIDGWHSEEAVIEDFLVWSAMLVPEAIVVFDDFAQHAEVQQGIRKLMKQRILPGEPFLVGKMIGFAAQRQSFGPFNPRWKRRP